MTPGLLAAIIWLTLGAAGGLVEFWLALKGRHDRGALIIHTVRERPEVVLLVFMFCMLCGPIQIGLLLGSYYRRK